MTGVGSTGPWSSRNGGYSSRRGDRAGRIHSAKSGRLQCRARAPGLTRLRCELSTEADGAGHNEEHTDQKEDAAPDQESHSDRSEQIGVHTSGEVDRDPGAAVSVHHDDGPVAGGGLPNNFLGAGARGRFGPEALVRGSGRCLGAGNVEVVDPERRRPYLAQLAVVHVGEVGINVGARRDADEDVLVGRHIARLKAQRGNVEPDAGRYSEVLANVQVRRGDRRGINSEGLGLRGEVAVIPLRGGDDGESRTPREHAGADQTQHGAQNEHDDRSGPGP
ncbi:hypothetical protein [Cryobacterium sp. TMT1-66-1]|uniref:hypothetical protein n=1 Tax=Cryobacterium sp. TMT1-66-1 TaxID=1259242 RepID=UPI00106C6B54|nr:hypothetical protein [Cryobacterium sp. TMT1-66-1]TFD06578.1 hypothetical protein E3T29_09920 [Cryobacterium sp. TMT1-66-1]